MPPLAATPAGPATSGPSASRAPTGSSAAAVALAAATASLSSPANSSTPWINLTPLLPTAPSGREGAAMAYVPQSTAVILFGGLAHNRSLGDTWAFRNGRWTDLTPGLSLSPPGRYKAVFAYDPAEKGAVLFGGLSGTVYRNDTWLWNGSAWEQVATTNTPVAREDAAGTYDAADTYLLVFGGEQSNGSFLNDTWSYYRGTWTNLTAPGGHAPPAREAGSAVFDAADGVVLLFGGKDQSMSILHDTWIYKAGTWTDLTSRLTVAPAGRESFNLVYDSVDGYVLLYGGFHFPNSLSDEWSFSNDTWTPLSLSLTPPPREDAAMAYDPGRQLPYVVLFGGRTDPTSNGTLLNDTWSYKRPISLLISATPAIDRGENVSFLLAASGGYEPLNFTWAGLPPGCASANNTSINCTPSATGTFLVNVTAVDLGGFSATSPDFAFAVNPLPAVSFVPSVTSGTAPLNVSFSSTLNGGTAPFAYAWSFGDTSTSTAADPSHVFFAGNFTVHLAVTDARGFVTQASFVGLNVSNPPSPFVTTASADVTTGVAPLIVQFNSTASGGATPYTFSWTFGDGATSPLEGPSHTYNTAGSYAASVVVRDAANQTSTDVVTITVSAPLPLQAAASGTPSSGVVPLTVAFIGSASNGVPPYRYAWSFGPAGATSTSQSPKYTYTTVGSYTATLTVTDAASSTSTATVQVLVAPPLAANFTAAVGSPYCSNGAGYALVSVAASASGGFGSYTYSWSFPGGAKESPAGAAAGSAVVAAGVNDTIALEVNDTSGASYNVTHAVSIAAIDCAIAATSTPAKTPWLLYAAVGVVAAIIAIEAILILRRRRPKA